MAQQPMQQPPQAPPGAPAQPGAQPDTEPGAGAPAGERKLYETLLAGLLDFMWGKGRADIQRQIQQTTKDTLATTIGHITFALVQQGAEQAEQAGKHLTADILMGVATEIIESLEKMAAAMNMQFDAQAVGLQALVKTLQDYSMSLPEGSQAQADAKAALKSFGQSTINDAAQTVQTIGARHGAAPFRPVAAQPTSPQGQPAPSAAPPADGLMGAAS